MERSRNIRIILAVIIITLVFGCCVMHSHASGRHDTKSTTDRTRYFTSYCIKAGDTLTSIAKEYMTEEYSSVAEYIEDVKTINNFNGDRIYVGAYLVLPYYAYPEDVETKAE